MRQATAGVSARSERTNVARGAPSEPQRPSASEGETRRLASALAAIDAANADDPDPVTREHPARMTTWIERLVDQPSDALLLAARAHHLRRWEVPRSTYPDGRAGYLKWRRDLHERHAADVAVILESQGYDPSAIERVQTIIRKRGLGKDAEVQAFEDALCLVFIETQFDDLAARTERAKMIEVTRKTLAKMSPAGVAQAVALVPGLAADSQAIVAEATA
jgi:hypothetical protein